MINNRQGCLRWMQLTLQLTHFEFSGLRGEFSDYSPRPALFLLLQSPFATDIYLNLHTQLINKEKKHEWIRRATGHE
jgi:hypothetical protein